MATRVKKAAPADLVVRLDDPGMTPLLRAGLGGLAASLRAIARADGASWPLAGGVTVPLGAGCAVVDASGVTLRWNGKPPEQTLKRLFERQNGDVLEVIKLKEIYEKLESAVDRCEDVANVIQAVVLRHT